MKKAIQYVYTCDSCEWEIWLESPEPEQEIECPKCDLNIYECKIICVHNLSSREFCNEMQSLKELDTEKAHVFMDKLMCGLLTKLGYRDGIEVFENRSKWYS